MSLDSALTASARVEAAGRDRSRLRRQALSAGRRSFPRERRVGLNFRRKCRTEHRILVDLLANAARDAPPNVELRRDGAAGLKVRLLWWLRQQAFR